MDGSAALNLEDPIEVPAPKLKTTGPGETRQPEQGKSNSEPDAGSGKKRGAGRYVLIFLALVALAAGGMWVRDWWLVGRFMVSTDDAYVQADITSLSSEVPGKVASVLATDNTRVEKGQPILKLDARDLTLAVDRARAALNGAEASSKRLEAQIVAAQAGIRQAEAAVRSAAAVLTNAERNHTRIEQLASHSVAAEARLDDATAALEQARAGRDQADAALASAKAQLEVLNAQRDELAAGVAQARAALGVADLNLSRATVTAPVAGILTGFHPATGNMIAAGQQLGSIVPTDSLYVEANYKETQMPGLTPGAEVEIEFDAIPDRTFTGHVDSIAAATGSQFSVLPSQNATGNFTKVVQRVPVRIEIPAEALATGHVRAGLSVVVSTDSRTGEIRTANAD